MPPRQKAPGKPLTATEKLKAAQDELDGIKRGVSALWEDISLNQEVCSEVKQQVNTTLRDLGIEVPVMHEGNMILTVALSGYRDGDQTIYSDARERITEAVHEVLEGLEIEVPDMQYRFTNGDYIRETGTHTLTVVTPDGEEHCVVDIELQDE